MHEIPVVLCGLGQIGLRLLKQMSSGTSGLKPVVVVDSDPDLIGRDAAAMCGLRGISLPVQGSFSGTGKKAEVAVITTVSAGEIVISQVQAALEEGLSAVTSCEELFHPEPELEEALRPVAEMAEKQELAILAAGVNPGFLMDVLPVALSAASSDIRRIFVERVQDASGRRSRFQDKIGAGLTPVEFAARAEENLIRHVGLSDSVRYVASALNWNLASLTEEVSPVLAERDLAREGRPPIPAGHVKGIRQVASGALADGREVVRLEFEAAIGAGNPRDRIVVEGEPRIENTIAGGLQGDGASCALLCAAVRRLASSRQTGFLTMRDLPALAGMGLF